MVYAYIALILLDISITFLLLSRELELFGLWNSRVGCIFLINPLSANPEKWSNTLKQIVGNLPTICLTVFVHFMNLALKGLNLDRHYNLARLIN